MSGKILARASAILLALVLAACGGDDGSSSLAGPPSSPNDGNGGDPAVPNATVASIQLISSTPSIGSAGRDQATITAQVRDGNGVLTPEVDLVFNASNNGSLNVDSSTTSDSGQATATLTTNGDPRNRTITVSATAGSVSGSVDVAVTGTSLSLSGPSAISNNTTATFEARLLNSASEGISGVPVSVQSSNGNQITGNTTTDSSGRVRFTLDAQNSGQDTVSVSAYGGASLVSSELTVNISSDNFAFNELANSEVEIGDTQTVSVTWTRNGSPVSGEVVDFSTTRGTLSNSSPTTDGTGVASVDISASNVGIADITAFAEGLDGEVIEATQQIEFVSSEPYTISSLRASKTQVSTEDEADIIATVKDQGGNLVKNAVVEFNLLDPSGGTISPGTVRTDSQGIAITTYSSSQSISDKDGVEITASIERADATTYEEVITLTVAGRALTLTLGTGNTITEPNTTLYDMPWSVLVTDANGNASGNQPVQLSVLPMEFRKGSYTWNGNMWVPNVTESCQTNHADPATGTEISNPAAAPGTVTTDETGTVEFNIRYPQGECNWVQVKLTATSNVEGFSSSNSRTFTLPCLSDHVTDEDVTPPGGGLSPYNPISCN